MTGAVNPGELDSGLTSSRMMSGCPAAEVLQKLVTHQDEEPEHGSKSTQNTSEELHLADFLLPGKMVPIVSKEIITKPDREHYQD